MSPSTLTVLEFPLCALRHTPTNTFATDRLSFRFGLVSEHIPNARPVPHLARSFIHS